MPARRLTPVTRATRPRNGVGSRRSVSARGSAGVMAAGLQEAASATSVTDTARATASLRNPAARLSRSASARGAARTPSRTARSAWCQSPGRLTPVSPKARGMQHGALPGRSTSLRAGRTPVPGSDHPGAPGETRPLVGARVHGLAGQPPHTHGRPGNAPRVVAANAAASLTAGHQFNVSGRHIRLPNRFRIGAGPGRCRRSPLARGLFRPDLRTGSVSPPASRRCAAFAPGVS